MPFSEGARLNPYTVYHLVPRYRTVTGRKQMPTSQGECEIVTLHAPYSQKIVEFEAVRDGLPPVLPAPESGDPNLVLIDWEIGPVVPPPLDGTNRRYTVTGVYVYAMRQALVPGQALDTGMLPMTTDNAQQNRIGPENFSTTLLSPSGPQNASFAG